MFNIQEVELINDIKIPDTDINIPAGEFLEVVKILENGDFLCIFQNRFVKIFPKHLKYIG